jgi:hypothetical protein
MFDNKFRGVVHMVVKGIKVDLFLTWGINQETNMYYELPIVSKYITCPWKALNQDGPKVTTRALLIRAAQMIEGKRECGEGETLSPMTEEEITKVFGVYEPKKKMTKNMIQSLKEILFAIKEEVDETKSGKLKVKINSIFDQAIEKGIIEKA